MPMFDTGNAQWDQGLASLGNSLFPDPSKVAQGYYYGSEARKAQIESLDKTNQMMAKGPWMTQATWNPTQPLPQPTFSQPSIENMPAVMLNSPAAAAAMDPRNPGPPALAQAMQTNPTLPGQLAAQHVNTAVDNYNASRATLATNPPVPETPNATPPTGTSGNNVSYNTPMAPGSVVDPDGGIKNAGPATHTGSPSPMAITPAQTAAIGSMAGFDAPLVQANVQAGLSTAFMQGRLARPQYEAALAGAGQAGPYTTGQTVAGEMARQQLVTGELAREFDLHPETVVGPDGKPINVPRSQSYNREPFDFATSTFGPAVNPNDANAAPVLMRPQQVQAQGYTPAATGTDQQRAQAEQRWQRLPPGPDKDQAYRDMIALNATPKEIDPAKEAQQRLNDYRDTQSRYAMPQQGIGKLAIKDPVALRTDAQDLVNARADQLRRMPGFYQAHPERAQAKAEQDAIANGEIESPDQVNANRRGQILSTAGGVITDKRLEVRQPPIKGAKPINHMMINLTPKGREAAQALGIPVGNAPPVSNAAATDGGGGTDTGTVAPANRQYPAALRGTPAPASPSFAATPNAPAPGYATPPAPSGRLPKQGAPAAAAAAQQPSRLPRQNPANNPALSNLVAPTPAPTAPAFTAATPAPAQPAPQPAPQQTVLVGGQGGPIGRAQPGAAEGSIQYLPGGRSGIVRGGLIYPIPGRP